MVDFRAAFPDDDACLDWIFKFKFPNLVCPKCGRNKQFSKVKRRRSYACPCCTYQIYPTKDTIFEKTTTPLSYWFYSIFMSVSKGSGLSARHIERSYPVCYTTALRTSHRIKRVMDQPIKFYGISKLKRLDAVLY